MDFEKTYLKVLEDIEANYSYLKHRGIKIDDLRKKSNEFKDLQSEKEFAEKLAEVFTVFEDTHLKVVFEEKHLRFKRKTTANYDYTVLKRYIDKPEIRNSACRIKKLDKTLYVLAMTWVNQNKKDLDDALEFFKNHVERDNFNKIIFDVRPNGGGNSDLALAFLKPLIPKGTKIDCYKCEYANKPGIKLNGLTGSGGFNGKIIALTGQNCVSSTELFLLTLREMGATLIGDKTYGSSGNPKEFKYGSVSVLIPSWILYTIRGEMVEGKGIEPDIKIPASESIKDGRDLVLEKALEY